MEYWKLIELLNEYIKKEYVYWEYGVYINKQNKLILEKQQSFMGYWIDEEWYDDMEFWESIIISKKFWFIEQLIKRNEIDLWKLFTSDIEIPLREIDGWNDVKMFSTYESLLMILSIQDNPLEYLCSILKEK